MRDHNLVREFPNLAAHRNASSVSVVEVAFEILLWSVKQIFYQSIVRAAVEYRKLGAVAKVLKLRRRRFSKAARKKEQEQDEKVYIVIMEIEITSPSPERSLWEENEKKKGKC